MHTPVAAFFKTIGNVAFNFMIPILGGYIRHVYRRPAGAAGGLCRRLSSDDRRDVCKRRRGCSLGLLGALFAGFAGGYLMLGFEKLCQKLPKSLDGIKGCCSSRWWGWG